MELNLLMVGGGAALLFVIYSVGQMLRGRFQINFLSTLLAFAAALAPMTALIMNRLRDQPNEQIELSAIGIALVVLVGSALVFLVEHRRAAADEKIDVEVSQSRGVLGVGIGTLLLISTLVTPLLTGMVAPPATMVDMAALASATPEPTGVIAATEEAEATSEPVARAATPSPQPTTALTRETRPVPQLPTVPPELLVLPASALTTEVETTVEAEATADAVEAAERGEAAREAVCTGEVTNNLNMRGGPSMDASILLTIPYESVVPIYGQSTGGFWLAVEYDATEGWVSSQYINRVCDDLPVLP